MGACFCGSGKDQLIYNGTVKNIDRKQLPSEYRKVLALIKSEYQIKDFTLSANGIPINNQETYSKVLKRRAHFTITDLQYPSKSLKTFEPETDFCKNICPEYHQNLCKVTAKFLELRALIIGEGFLFISLSYFSRGIPKDLQCEFMSRKKIIRSLSYLNTFQEICFFKIITKKSSDLKKLFIEKALQKENNLKIWVDHELVSVERSENNPNMLNSKVKTFDRLKIGDCLFGQGVFLGVLIKIFDPFSAEIVFQSLLVEISSEIKNPSSTYNLPDQPENQINDYLGSVLDENGSFLFPWFVISEYFVLIPQEISSSEVLQLSLRGKLHKLTITKIDTPDKNFSKLEFSVYKFEKNLDFSLPESFSGKINKRTKLPYGDGKTFDLKKFNENELIINEKINHLFFGYMLFSHSKLAGIVTRVLKTFQQ
jgi:hypothetical protein